MTNFIPIFPLELVVYPGEMLNLHIFEPRYKQLIQEVAAEKKIFGIPAVINGEMKELGTTMQLIEITKEYDDGRMDIKTKGIQVFKVLETIKEIPDKLYSGAIVTYPNFTMKGSAHLMQKIITSIREILNSLEVHKEFPAPDNELTTYHVAHHAGMGVDEEYILLELEHELHRQEFLRRHLEKVQPVVEQMKKLKEKVKQNGHFKDLKGFGMG